MPKSFAPVADKNTKILIVGSMPGEASLRAAEYYAYKYNMFWPIIYKLFSPRRAPQSYEEKLKLLLSNGLGLWDSLAACSRKGSADGNIKEEKPNDFKTLYNKYPQIKKVLFNGQAAHKYYFKYFEAEESKEYRLMPSTSPAAATKTFEEKFEIWKRELVCPKVSR